MNADELRERAYRFWIDVIALCDSLPRSQSTLKITGQLQDAASSAAMNYRAACRGRSHAEFTAKLCIVVEEADEAVGWLQTLIDTKKASGPEALRLLRESEELLKIFAKSKRTALGRGGHPRNL